MTFEMADETLGLIKENVIQYVGASFFGVEIPELGTYCIANWLEQDNFGDEDDEFDDDDDDEEGDSPDDKKKAKKGGKGKKEEECKQN